jgi:hypothetical protein
MGSLGAPQLKEAAGGILAQNDHLFEISDEIRPESYG